MAGVLGLLVLLSAAAALLLVLLTSTLVRGARRPPRRTAAYAVARGLPCDPGDLGLDFESWWLDRPGGVRLPVWEVATTVAGDERSEPPDGSPPGPTVVFLHGWGQSRIDMLARAPSWRDRAARLVFYDLRGHGDAGGAVSDLGHDEEEDLLALLAELGPGPVLLVGFSMGAVIALHAAAAARDRGHNVVGVIAYGPYGDFHRSLQGRLRVTGYPARPFTDLAILWLRLVGIRHREVRTAAAGMACPLLVVHGEEDAISPLEHAEDLVDCAADAALVRVAGASHLDAEHLDPEGHQEAVDGFLRRIDAGGARGG